MKPQHATAEQIIKQLGVKDKATADHLRRIFGETHGGPLGTRRQGALCLDQKIQFLEFEKIGKTQVSVKMFEPQLHPRDQAAIVAYIGDAHASANEILTLVHQAAALRAGKQGSFLLLTDDGTPPTQMHIDGYGDLVFDPVAELTIPTGRT